MEQAAISDKSSVTGDASKSNPTDSQRSAPASVKKTPLEMLKGSFQTLQVNGNLIVLVILFSAGVAIVASLLFFWVKPAYKPLYASQEGFSPSDIIQVLETEGIPFEMNPNNGLILVPDGDVAKTRMLLSAKGVRAELPVGFDNLGQQGALGTSQFLEKAQFTRGLEGELVKSMVSLEAVSNARVHLSIPRETLFVGKDKPVPTASVLVSLKSGMSLTPIQVQSLVNLVSGSVAGMKPENVSVTDQFGRFLSEDVFNSDFTVANVKQIEFKKNIEDKIKKQVNNLLAPMLGVDNFRVEATAKVDFSKVTETKETFDTTPVVLNEQIVTNNTTIEAAVGIPGSLSNNPPLTETPTPDTANNSDLRSEINKRYAVGSSVTQTEKQQGQVEQLSVSVVVNESVAPNGAVWQPQDLAKIQAIVSSALGITENDQININAFVFNPVSLPNPAITAWYEQENNQQLIKYGVFSAVVIFVVFAVLRPLVKTITDSIDKKTELQVAQEEAVSETTQHEVDIEKEIQNRLEAMGLKDTEIDMLEHMLPDPNSPIEVQIKHLQLLTEHHPERVSEIIRNWINA
ncbi:flagellar basal-body MS-ring/collar protein FliF [Vibrio sp.]|nr:flagellar basal-body MS-ring/collar protein FliF [Vibrio sp.]